MIISRFLKPELIASTDETRAPINRPYISEGTHKGIRPCALPEGCRAGSIAATDGRRLFVCAVALEPLDVAGYIPGALLAYARRIVKPVWTKTARGQVKKMPDEIKIRLGRKSLLFSNGAIFPRDPGKTGAASTFPNTEQVVPEGATVGTNEIGLNPALINELAEAMGCKQKNHSMICRFRGNTNPVELRDRAEMEINPGVLGVCMPMYIKV
jgi:hypothetical protein